MPRTRRERERLNRLYRRRDYLRDLARRGQTNTYDDAEESALTWVLDYADEADRDRAALDQVRTLLHSEQVEKFRDEAARGTVALPYASNRYMRLVDDLRAAIGGA